MCDWIVCICVSAAVSHAMETLKLIKGWRRPPPPKQLVTGWSPAGSTEAPAAAKQRPEVPSLLRLCVTGAALQSRTDKNPQKSMDAQQQRRSSVWLLLLWCCSLKADLIVVSWWIGNREADRNKNQLPRTSFSTLEDYLCFWMADPQTADLTATCKSKHRARSEHNEFAQYSTKSLSAKNKLMAAKDIQRQTYQVFSLHWEENIIQSC